MNIARTLVATVFCSALAPVALAQPSVATQRLLAHNTMFEPDIIQVYENIYTAIGYQVSTNTMIIGDDGVIIIDPRHLLPKLRMRVRFPSPAPIRY